MDYINYSTLWDDFDYKLANLEILKRDETFEELKIVAQKMLGEKYDLGDSHTVHVMKEMLSALMNQLQYDNRDKFEKKVEILFSGIPEYEKRKRELLDSTKIGYYQREFVSKMVK